MIQYIFNKTIWKGYDRESQEVLHQLIEEQTLIDTLCQLVWFFILLYTLIPGAIFAICEAPQLKPTTVVAITCFSCISGLLFAFVDRKLSMPLNLFSQALSKRIYYMLVTKKGQALSIDDLKVILERQRKLFLCISTGDCRGLCYSVCFNICQSLQKGHLEFIATKLISPHEEKENYTMHVLYVNNGWAFDTFSARQFPLDKIHEIYDAKIYRTFTYDDIRYKTYTEFTKEHASDAYTWSANNDCYINWLGDKRS